MYENGATAYLTDPGNTDELDNMMRKVRSEKCYLAAVISRREETAKTVVEVSEYSE